MGLRSPYSARRGLVLVALVGAWTAPVEAAAPGAGAPDGATPAAVSNDPPPEPAQPARVEAAQDDGDLLQLFGFRASPPLEPQRGKIMMFVVPAFYVNPAVGVALGVAASAAVALGDPSNTTVSNLSASAMLTTKEQFLGSFKSVLLTDHNDWELLGDARFQSQAQATYGLGTGATPVSGGFHLNAMTTSAVPGEQPMRFEYVRVHETAFRRVVGNAYAGVGYHLDLHWNVVDESLDPSASPPVVTSHYAYSRVEGFDPTHYSLSGISLNALHESRDHTLDPYEGNYLLLSWRVNPEWLGSSKASSVLYGEARTYVSLSERRPRHLLAFWTYVHAVTTGAVPYLDLPALGYDVRDRSGRGYPQGRFRGTALVYGEVEYRFPITRRGLLGGVAFVNATTAARPSVNEPSLGVQEKGIALFDAVEPAAGLGLRIMADRQARMNLVVDYAIGRGGSNGLYLSVGESF
jgi:hypothetical protein